MSAATKRRSPLAYAGAAVLAAAGISLKCFANDASFRGLKSTSDGVARSAASASVGILDHVPGMPPLPKLLPGETYASCEEEMEFEVSRDRFFASLTPETMPRPFPVDTFPVEYVTPDACEALSEFGRGDDGGDDSAPKVVVHLEVYKDIPMIKRIMERLANGPNHAFLIHLATDVPQETIDLLREYSADGSPGPLCVISGGFVRYKTSTDIRILFSSMEWLLRASAGWDFFISMSGADFPVMTGPVLSRELRAVGNKSWSSPPLHDNTPVPFEKFSRKDRFTQYGLTCEETKIFERREGREFWLENLMPEIQVGWSVPISSGGIWHRSMIEFLIKDDRARAAYMYFRHHPCAGVEHYWQTLYTLPELRDMIVDRLSCAMWWGPVGRYPDMTHNSFMPMDTWDEYIKPAIDSRVPFIRKFDSVKEADVIDRIEAYAEELYGQTKHPEGLNQGGPVTHLR